MRTENLLPKFESPKNPFAGLQKAEQPVATAAPVVAAAAPMAKAATGVMETSFLFDAQLQPVAVVAEVKPVVAAPVAQVESKPASPVVVAKTPVAEPAARPAAPVEAKAKPLSEWVKKLNPLAHLPTRETESKPARPRTAVQTELSLERVKVVRNELNDTDLEVVLPARAVEKTEFVGPKLQPMARTDETTLSRLTSRFFSAGQPQV
jgi:hypothetical protein